MPYINKTQIRPKRVPYRNEVKEDNAAFYGSIAWKRLRNTYLSLHPLCECCVQHQVVSPAEHVHHKKPFMSGKTEEERWSLFLDEDNIMSVCRDCHNALHNKINRYKMLSCDELTEKEYQEAHDIYMYA